MSQATQPSLSNASIGAPMVVDALSGDAEIVCQLYSLGFGEGSGVVLEKAGNPCIVSVGASRIAIDRGIVEHIRVREAVVAPQAQSVKDAGRAMAAEGSGCANVAVPVTH